MDPQQPSPRSIGPLSDDPAVVNDPSRRRLLIAFGGATAVAWTAPQIMAMDHAGAATTYNVTYDANCALTAGGPVPFTISCDADMTNGGAITMDTAGCTFLSGTGSGECLASSPPGKTFSASGVVSGAGATITFPDQTGTEQCLYQSFSLSVSCVS